MLFQLFFALFYLIYLIALSKKKLRGKIHFTELLFRLGFWTLALVVVVYPDITVHLAQWMGIQRGVDLIVYVGIAVLFYHAFNQRLKHIRSSITITELTRQMAIMEYRLTHSGKK